MKVATKALPPPLMRRKRRADERRFALHFATRCDSGSRRQRTARRAVPTAAANRDRKVGTPLRGVRMPVFRPPRPPRGNFCVFCGQKRDFLADFRDFEPQNRPFGPQTADFSTQMSQKPQSPTPSPISPPVATRAPENNGPLGERSLPQPQIAIEGRDASPRRPKARFSPSAPPARQVLPLQAPKNLIFAVFHPPTASSGAPNGKPAGSTPRPTIFRLL